MRRQKLFISLLALILLLPAQASAAGNIRTDRDVSLTIQYAYNGQAISGAAFDLHYVAEVSESAEFTLAGGFQNYPISIDGQNNGEWKKLASTLSGYVKRDDLTPIDSGKTDGSGVLSFPNQQEQLKPGLYLVIGRRLSDDRYTYNTEPFLICLPNTAAGDDIWNYNVGVKPKCDLDENSNHITAMNSTVYRKVLKKWNDDGHEEQRPEKIVVQLLRDGTVYDTVTLNKENNWRYTWDALDRTYDWEVVEKEISGYTVIVSKEGITFLITNTYDETEEPPDNPPDSPPDSPPDTPSDKPYTDIPDEDVPIGSLFTGDNLPQTGTLWWPVPLLASSGLLLFVLGWLIDRRAEDDA